MKLQWHWPPQPGVDLDRVWVPMAALEDLQDHPHNSLGTGDTVLLSADVGRVLEARGLAVRETRGGYHAGPALAEFMENLEYVPAPRPAAAGPASAGRITLTDGSVIDANYSPWRHIRTDGSHHPLGHGADCDDWNLPDWMTP